MSRGFTRAAISTGLALVGVAGVVGLLRGAQGPSVRLAPGAPSVDTTILKTYKWRSIGPLRGGRSIAVSGVRGQPNVGYFGATGGGLWKTTDTGKTWTPVTDHQISSASVGAVAVSESNPNVVFIGTGEGEIRGNIMPGDGVYKSADAGKTWKKVGFENSDAIAKIRIHPTNENVVFVADFGKYGVPSEERGLFKSTDGGATWKKVLYRGPKTGSNDVIFDRANPNVMYATMWEAYRNEWGMSSGGEGSGLFKSTDGGDTWTDITRAKGLPEGVDGKIDVAVSPANSNRVYALVENENGGLFRSDDAGATWTKVNENRNIRQRAFYYTHVIADPKNQDEVYALNTSAYRSTDGGKTLQNVGGGTHGDTHDLWIDPDNGDHMMMANDGGGTVTTNGGKAWTAEDYPTGQFYHVVATANIPYYVCGSQQDDNEMCVSTAQAGGFGRGFGGGRGRGAAPDEFSPAGAEDGYIAPDPLDPDIFYSGTNANGGGFLTKDNRHTGERREVSPYPRMFSGEESAVLKERWQWTYPIVFSPVNPHVLYTSSQHLFMTTNGGDSWTRISPDLTRHDPKTMGPSGGPITRDMNGPEVYAVIFSIAPSKRTTNVIWTGSDDGIISVTKNAGKTWANVTPKDMPDFGRVSMIDASAFDSASAYVAVKRPLLDDKAPYIYRTHDFGKTWTKIVNGIRGDDYVHSVKEDPTRKGLLYAATQHGVYISYDDGDHWESLSLNLPDVPVSDIIVTDHDLAIATHGRGFYILDNINPLRQYTASVAAGDAYLFKPATAIRSSEPLAIQYLLKTPAKDVRIDILDAHGQVVRTYPDTANENNGRGRGGPPADAAGRGGRGRGGAFGPSKNAGLQTFDWDLRYAPAASFPGMILWGGGTTGPQAPPGRYSVRLTADGKTLTQPITVKRNPLHSATDADLAAQFALAIQLRDKLSEANRAVIQIRDVKSQVSDRLAKSSDAQLTSTGDKLATDLSGVEGEIYQVKNQSGQDPLNFPIKVNNRLASLLGVVSNTDAKPIASAYPIFNDLKAELKVQTDRLQHVLSTELPAFNAQAKKLGLAPITVSKPVVF
ncbi:MAG TPA: glycosyl hydrolase [Gemmatimonadaceae bacterium]|nr:glycosyl hydrolase [Gemmatimonadaceae bacterium]